MSKMKTMASHEELCNEVVMSVCEQNLTSIMREMKPET